MEAETLSIGREIQVRFSIQDLAPEERIELFRWLVEDMKAEDVCGFDRVDDWRELFENYCKEAL
jgi:hypothetical protein